MYQYRTKILHDVSVCLLTNHVSQISGWLIRGRPPFPPKIGTATGPLPPLPYFRHCWCCFEIRWQDCARETVFPLHVTSRTSRIFMYWEPAFTLYCPALVTLNITLQSAWLRTNLTCSTSCPALVGFIAFKLRTVWLRTIFAYPAVPHLYNDRVYQITLCMRVSSVWYTAPRVSVGNNLQ